jgi:hypothetical protein
MPRTNAERYAVLLDPEDEHLREQYRWCDNGEGYAKAWDRNKRACVYLHRVVTGAQAGQVVDHINRNRADNRRSNLRIATRTENALNSPKKRCRAAHGRYSRHIGVAWIGYKWVANYRGKYLGVFHDENEAALAYNRAVDADGIAHAARNNVEIAA